MENMEILSLKVITDNLIDLIQFYFTAWSAYHASMREAAVPIVFGGGLIWITVMALKLPEDKLQAVVGSLLVLGVVGILLAPAKDTSVMYSGFGTGEAKVANGSVWTFKLVGNVYELFKGSTDEVFKANLIGEATGGTSYRTNPHAVLYADAAEKMSAALKDSEGFEMVTSYMALCSKVTEGMYNDGTKLEALRGVGLGGSNLLGVNEEDLSVIQGFMRAAKEAPGTVSSNLDRHWYSYPVGIFTATMDTVDTIRSPVVLRAHVERGVELLESIPEEDNPFRGGTVHGFQIPTQAYFDEKLFGKTGGAKLLDPRTFQGGNYIHSAISNGSELNPDQAFLLYPKNCAEAHELSNLAMAAMRDSNNQHSLETDPVLRARDNLTGQARLAELARRSANGYLKDLKLDPLKSDSSFLENSSDNLMGWLIDLAAKVGEFLLRFKVPMMVSVSAMLAAALFVTFPLFAVMSVFLGPQILITFFKLVVFAFLVIYLNDLFLSLATEILYFQTMSSAQAFNTGFNAGLSPTLAASTTKAIIFSVLTVVEVAAARLILWDDAKALSGFKPGSIGTDRASSMAKTIGAAAFTALSLGKAVSVAGKGASAAKATSSLTSAAGSIAGSSREISASASQMSRGVPGSNVPRGSTSAFKGSLNPASSPRHPSSSKP